MGVIIAIISGAVMSIQGVFNTKVTESSSIWTANIWIQGTALLTCLFCWFIWDRGTITSVFQVQPKYMLIGGVLGAGITWTVIQSMSKMGPAKAVLCIVISQIIVAYVIELWGLFGVDKTAFSMHKCIGALVAILGVIIFSF